MYTACVYAMLGWLCVVGGIGVVLRLRTHKQLQRDTRCGRCGYARDGGFARCPECGTFEKDQARVWRRKYRRVQVGVMLVAIVGGYAVTVGTDVRQRGWAAALPDRVLLLKVEHELKQMMTGNPDGHDIVTMHRSWWHRELDQRVPARGLSDNSLRGFSERLLALEQRDDISFEAWESCCWWHIFNLRNWGLIDQEKMFDLARRDAIIWRDWYVKGGIGKWWRGCIFMLSGKQDRQLEVVIEGSETRRYEIKIWANQGPGVGSDVPRDTLPPPSQDGYRVRMKVTEASGGGTRTVFEHTKDLPIRVFDSWAEAPFPGNTRVLQTAEAWRDACNPRVMGVLNADGSWTVVSPFWTAYLDGFDYEEIGVGVRVTLEVNGESVYTNSYLVRDAYFEVHDGGGLVILENRGVSADAPRVDYSKGDTVELILEPDREKALENRRATSYWEGRIVIPITKIEAYPYTLPHKTP